MGVVSKTVVSLVLASSILGTVDAQPVAAMTESSIGCGVGTETVSFGFAQAAPARISIFAYRINNGAWKFTPWYYTWNGFAWVFEGGRWVDTNGGVASFVLAGSNNLVEGYEYRYDPNAGSGGWIYLGSCRTSSFFRDGITYTYN